MLMHYEREEGHKYIILVSIMISLEYFRREHQGILSVALSPVNRLRYQKYCSRHLLGLFYVKREWDSDMCQIAQTAV